MCQRVPSTTGLPLGVVGAHRIALLPDMVSKLGITARYLACLLSTHLHISNTLTATFFFYGWHN